jgi:hypothetical protein
VGLNIAYLLDDRRRNIDVTRTDFINMDHVAAYHITTFYVNGFNLLLAFIRVRRAPPCPVFLLARS